MVFPGVHRLHRQVWCVGWSQPSVPEVTQSSAASGITVCKDTGSVTNDRAPHPPGTGGSSPLDFHHGSLLSSYKCACSEPSLQPDQADIYC